MDSLGTNLMSNFYDVGTSQVDENTIHLLHSQHGITKQPRGRPKIVIYALNTSNTSMYVIFTLPFSYLFFIHYMLTIC